VLVADLAQLERDRDAEDRLAVLHRHDPARGEALTVADAVDGVQHRDRRIAGTQEVRVERVRGPSFDGAAGSGQRLRRDLPAEQPLALAALVLAAEDVALDLLEREQLDQPVHGASA